jgi:peptidoglycan hydrolase CwlO-like protein
MLIVLAATEGVSSPAFIIAVLSALIGGSGIAGWLTVRSTNKSLAVEASDNAVDAVNKALERIEHELDEARAEVERLRKQLAEARDKAVGERSVLQERINQLQERVVYLEKVISKYKRRSEDLGEDAPPYFGPERRNIPGEERNE